MTEFNNHALTKFIGTIRNGLVFGLVWIGRTANGFEIRHLADREAVAGSLKEFSPVEARAIAQDTEVGAFRPLKSAPNLKRGWRIQVRTDDELEGVLNQLHPGGIADWHAARTDPPPLTNYRSFTARQTGMYRITTKLTDAQAGQMIRACCDRRVCVKQRVWTVEGLEPDLENEKTLVSCLEPCAVLLEFARKSVRIEQEEKMKLELAPDEIETVKRALNSFLEQPDNQAREGDFGDPTNARRILLMLEKLAVGTNAITNAGEK